MGSVIIVVHDRLDVGSRNKGTATDVSLVGHHSHVEPHSNTDPRSPVSLGAGIGVGAGVCICVGLNR